MTIIEARKEKIKLIVEHIRTNVIHNHLSSEEELMLRIEKLASMLKGEIQFDKTVLSAGPNINPNYWYGALNNFIQASGKSEAGLVFYFEEDHPLIQNLIHPEYLNPQFFYHLWKYILRRITFQPVSKVIPFIQFLLRQGFDEDDIIRKQIEMTPTPFRVPNVALDPPLNGFGEFMLPLLEEKKGFLGIGGKISKAHLIHETLFNTPQRTIQRDLAVLTFLYGINPELIEDKIPQYVISMDYNKKPILSMHAVRFLFEKNAVRYEKLVLGIVNQVSVQPHEFFEIYTLLHYHTPLDRSEKIIPIGEEFLSSLAKASPGIHYADHQVHPLSMSTAYADFLLHRDKESGKVRIVDYLRNYEIVFPHFLKHIHQLFGEECVPMLAEAIGKDPKWAYGKYYKTLFDILDEYDYTPFAEKAFQYVIHKASKEDRETICHSLAKQGGIVIEKATELLSGKTVNERIIAAMILSQISSPEIKTLLHESVDTETNDDTRNIILETLRAEHSASDRNYEEILAMIRAAERRKKLNKWNEKNLTEESLASLYWTQSGNALNVSEIRFLFYRMKQSKGMNSDIEAREAIKHIDKNRSEKFASHLLQVFIDSDADSKLKYYLTLSGMLGGDMILTKLNTLFRKSIADKRVKMAEHVLGAIAMIGSDKALRILEVISRKFANKKPILAKAALDSLDAAAEELNITQDQLADRIVPDFGFGGLYKEFKAGEETYRAFINGEFKLSYSDENRKIRKSPPANADKETLAEFKETEKEIREIVRTQQGRLEKYMIEGRKWNVEEWKKLFFNNPVMFVYATKLIWALFDANDTLVNVFYCDEDMESWDVHDEAANPDDGTHLRILHPTDLTPSQLQEWKDKIYHSHLKTIFPILERTIFQKREEEYELNMTKTFFNEDVPKGADFVIAHLTKCGWRKQSGDGGRVELTKHIHQPAIHAYANIEGPAVVYQGGTAKAIVYEISFIGKNYNDKVKIKDVPNRFYSETMADIDAMIKSN